MKIREAYKGNQCCAIIKSRGRYVMVNWIEGEELPDGRTSRGRGSEKQRIEETYSNVSPKAVNIVDRTVMRLNHGRREDLKRLLS